MTTSKGDGSHREEGAGPKIPKVLKFNYISNLPIIAGWGPPSYKWVDINHEITPL